MRERVKKLLTWISAALLSLMLAAALGLGWLYWRYADEVPDHLILLSGPAWREKCRATEGPQELVPFRTLPANVVNAYIARIDVKFHTRPRLTAWSFAAWLSRQQFPFKRGGLSELVSPFTKYAAELLNCGKELDPHNGVRVLKTLLLAHRIERDISKEVILEQFINFAPNSYKIYGPSELSKLYFHKRIDEITLAETAFIAHFSLSKYGDYSRLNHFHSRPSQTLRN